MDTKFYESVIYGTRKNLKDKQVKDSKKGKDEEPAAKKYSAMELLARAKSDAGAS
jgi:hypothetical protein